jgi:RimJ/RimL family protein N-acetyltransferase
MTYVTPQTFLAPESQARYSQGRAMDKLSQSGADHPPTRGRPPMKAVSIRRAGPRDSRRLFRWRNDEQTRKASASTAGISWADHRRWFRQSLSREDRWLYIASSPVLLRCGPAIGMCRFDLIDTLTAEVSINLNPRYRGKGFGPRILEAAVDRWRADEPTPRSILARVRPSNTASVKTFLRAGFSLSEGDGEFEVYRLSPEPS